MHIILPCLFSHPFQNSLSVHKQQFLFVFEEEFEEYPSSCCIFHLHKVGLCLNSIRCSVNSIEIAEGNKRVRNKRPDNCTRSAVVGVWFHNPF